MNKKKSSNIQIKKFAKKVYEIMLEENLQEIIWEEIDDFKIILRRRDDTSPVSTSVESKVAEEEKKEEDTAQYIRSPMNGVFYRSPSPNAEPFVKENDEIMIGTTVCIIEAMKLMNEVQVERHCRILEILIESGSPVKVNQPIYKIENL